jgi:hypothetical protein
MRALILAAALAASALPALAADKPPPPASVLFWSQAQKESGFPKMEAYFPMSTAARGETVHPLPAGAPLELTRIAGRAFDLSVYMEREKTAGILVLQERARSRLFLRRDRYGRFFTALMEAGTVIVTTSNRPPRDLYKDGLNRSLFLPFIDLVEARMDVLSLNGPTDYRLDRIGGLALWHAPIGDAATAQVREAFFRLTDFEPEDAAHVPSGELDLGGGRMLHVPKSLKGVGVFSFKKLCGENRGAADYLAIARAYHTVILVGIPRMGPANRM